MKNSSATRAAERFFKERRIPIQFVDLKVKPMAPGEIKRFIDKFGLPVLGRRIESVRPSQQSRPFSRSGDFAIYQSGVCHNKVNVDSAGIWNEEFQRDAGR